MGVSLNGGTIIWVSPILIGFSIINIIHLGVPQFYETPIYIYDISWKNGLEGQMPCAKHFQQFTQARDSEDLIGLN